MEREPGKFDWIRERLEQHAVMRVLFSTVEGFMRDEVTDHAAAMTYYGIFSLFPLMLLFMALPALNLINLNTGRILERSSEIGVRKAFGASSTTLVGQFVVESLVLSLLGGALGFALSGVVLGALNASGVIPYAELTLNLRIFFWGVAFSAAFGLLSGAYPAWRMSRLHPVEALRGRTQ